jgi:hypothetical protein
MASYGDVLSVLKDFRNTLEVQVNMDVQDAFRMPAMPRTFAARGGVSAFSTPLTNVHASGAGIRVRGGKPMPNDFVIKVYVFEKFDLGTGTPALTTQFQGVDVDVEPLPIQRALQKKTHEAPSGATPPIVDNRTHRRPVLGGVSIAPLNAPYVGTLGCLLARPTGGMTQIFALSNNHVLADTNRLTAGTAIVQPGGEVVPTREEDVFAALSQYIQLQFPPNRLTPIDNRFDAAIAMVTDHNLVKPGKILGISKYVPELVAAVPGMRVTKSGRTTGVTSGTVTATRVNGVQVNYGTQSMPLIATFNDTIEIIGDDGEPFSLPGDSGSVILEEATGRPVALLFAGDGRTTTTCDLGGVCKQLEAYPV